MQRLRFYDCRASRLPAAVGLCKADVLQLAEYVNTAQYNLLTAKEAGGEGWWGTWAEIAFTVSQTAPYYTAGRDIARLEVAAVCQRPVPIYNQFVEYLEFGNGRMPQIFRQRCHPHLVNVFSRNTVPLFVDMPTPPMIVQVYLSDPADVGKRVMISGTDNNQKPIYTVDGLNPITGIFVVLQSPFSTVPTRMFSITGIQKDITAGQVSFFGMDPTTGAQTLLLTMEPSETTASYRRYYFDGLPTTCCTGTGVPPSPITVTAIAKLDLIPVVVDTDYCLIQNREAIINECQAIRYSDMDTKSAKEWTVSHHKRAIGMLNGELTHFLGENEPAVNFRPFGSARLEHKKIGTLV